MKSIINSYITTKYIIILCTLVLVWFIWYLYSEYTYINNQKLCEQVAQEDIKKEELKYWNLIMKDIFYSRKMKWCYYEYIDIKNKYTVGAIKRTWVDFLYARDDYFRCYLGVWEEDTITNNAVRKMCNDEAQIYKKTKEMLKK